MIKRIESTQNSLVKYWKKLTVVRKEREKSKEFIIEGFHLVEEALKNKSQITHKECKSLLYSIFSL